MTELGLLQHLTHKANLKQTRYGWLRLTPAYSVHLVENILDQIPFEEKRVLDPFCGTGTTVLVCSERGIQSDTTDINPFLHWLTDVKTDVYNQKDGEDFLLASKEITNILSKPIKEMVWVPDIYQIEKWWSENVLIILSNLYEIIQNFSNTLSNKSTNLLKIAFCRLLINHSNANFNHQSMSIKKYTNISLFDEIDEILSSWNTIVNDVYYSAKSSILTKPNIMLCDARNLSDITTNKTYNCVITSPPYPNRMSYIRELRPYMYWLGYLTSGREAGELDWQAIGGTWGIATSNVGKWSPPIQQDIPFEHFSKIHTEISKKSYVLANYIHKYFYDIVDHINNLSQILISGASINYIVGNSKFYDVLLPVEQIYAAIFESVGFKHIKIQPIRKRTSKKELFEFHISAQK